MGSEMCIRDSVIPMGKDLQTISVNKNIISMTTIREHIPEQMAIYDLPLFLGALSLFKQPYLNFPDNKRVIVFDEETKGKTVFYYSDPSVIVTPPDFNGDLPDKELHFDLPQADITQLMQAAKIYGVEDLCIYGYEGDYSICVKDKKNDTSNVFSLPLKKVVFERLHEMSEERRNFCYCFKVENLKLIDASYHVTISAKNIASFSSLSHSDLTYYIALEP